LVCQIDLLASFAKLTGQTVTGGSEDSEELLDAFTGKSDKGRQQLVLEAVGNTCMRTTEWYFIPPHNGVETYERVNIESGYLPENQLYRIGNDISQITNVAKDNPEVVADLLAKYKKSMGEFYKPFVFKKNELILH
jgi:arylsulfatase A-like enzyme